MLSRYLIIGVIIISLLSVLTFADSVTGTRYELLSYGGNLYNKDPAASKAGGLHAASGSYHYTTLAYFDVSSISGTVTSATLQLSARKNYNANIPIDIYSVSEAWVDTSSTPTWNNKNTGTAWTTGPPTDGSSLGSVTVTSPNTTWETYNITGAGLTSAVQQWINGTNNGLFINGADQSAHYEHAQIQSATLLVYVLSGPQPPTVTLTAPTGDVNGSSVTISGSITSADGAISSAQYRVGSSDSWHTLSYTGSQPNYTISDTFDSTAYVNGSYTFEARARNAQGWTTNSTSIYITNTMPTPTVNLTAPTGTVIGSSVSINATVHFSGYTVNQAQWRIDSGTWSSSGISISGTAPNWTVSGSFDSTSYTEGSHTFSLRARDSGASSTTWGYDHNTININNVDENPVVTISSPTTTVSLGTINITASVTDDGSSLTLAQYRIDSGSWHSLTIGGSGGTYTLTGSFDSTPYDDSSSHTFEVRVNDDGSPANSGTDTVNFQVSTACTPTAINDLSDWTASGTGWVGHMATGYVGLSNATTYYFGNTGFEAIVQKTFNDDIQEITFDFSENGFSASGFAIELQDGNGYLMKALTGVSGTQTISWTGSRTIKLVAKYAGSGTSATPPSPSGYIQNLQVCYGASPVLVDAIVRDTPTNLGPGQVFEICVDFINRGPAPVTNARATITLPSGFRLQNETDYNNLFIGAPTFAGGYRWNKQTQNITPNAKLNRPKTAGSDAPRFVVYGTDDWADGTDHVGQFINEFTRCDIGGTYESHNYGNGIFNGNSQAGQNAFRGSSYILAASIKGLGYPTENDNYVTDELIARNWEIGSHTFHHMHAGICLHAYNGSDRGSGRNFRWLWKAAGQVNILKRGKQWGAGNTEAEQRIEYLLGKYYIDVAGGRRTEGFRNPYLEFNIYHDASASNYDSEGYTRNPFLTTTAGINAKVGLRYNCSINESPQEYRDGARGNTKNIAGRTVLPAWAVRCGLQDHKGAQDDHMNWPPTGGWLASKWPTSGIDYSIEFWNLAVGCQRYTNRPEATAWGTIFDSSIGEWGWDDMIGTYKQYVDRHFNPSDGPQSGIPNLYHTLYASGTCTQYHIPVMLSGHPNYSNDDVTIPQNRDGSGPTFVSKFWVNELRDHVVSNYSDAYFVTNVEVLNYYLGRGMVRWRIYAPTTPGNYTIMISHPGGTLNYPVTVVDPVQAVSDAQYRAARVNSAAEVTTLGQVHAPYTPYTHVIYTVKGADGVSHASSLPAIVSAASTAGLGVIAEIKVYKDNISTGTAGVRHTVMTKKWDGTDLPGIAMPNDSTYRANLVSLISSISSQVDGFIFDTEIPTDSDTSATAGYNDAFVNSFHSTWGDQPALRVPGNLQQSWVQGDYQDVTDPNDPLHYSIYCPAATDEWFDYGGYPLVNGSDLPWVMYDIRDLANSFYTLSGNIDNIGPDRNSHYIINELQCWENDGANNTGLSVWEEWDDAWTEYRRYMNSDFINVLCDAAGSKKAWAMVPGEDTVKNMMVHNAQAKSCDPIEFADADRRPCMLPDKWNTSQNDHIDGIIYYFDGTKTVNNSYLQMAAEMARRIDYFVAESWQCSNTYQPDNLRKDWIMYLETGALNVSQFQTARRTAMAVHDAGQGVFVTANKLPTGITTNIVVTITSPTNNASVYGTTALTANITAAPGNVTSGNVYYRIDSGSWTGGFSGSEPNFTRNINLVSIGTHTVWVRAQSSDGVWGTNSISVVVNDPPPVVTVTAPTGTVDCDSVSITGTATDTAPGSILPSSLHYRIDNGSWSTMMFSDPNCSATWDSTTVANGSHTVYIRASDNANQWTTNSATFTVNNQSPTVTINNPSAGQVSGAIVIDATLIARSCSLTGELYRIDSGSWINLYSQGGNDYTNVWDTGSVANGSHTIYVLASNSAKLTTTQSVVVYVTNTTPIPQITITAPTASQYVRGTTNISATIQPGAGATSLTVHEYRINSGSWVALSGTAPNYSAAWNTTSTADGAATVYVRAQNNVGEWATNSVAVTIDNTPPTIIISSPSAGVVSNNVTIDASTSSDSGSGLVTPLQYRIDSGSWTSLSGSGTAVWDSKSVSDGTHTIYVRGTDTIGNASTNTVSITVLNNDPPVVQTIINPTAGSHTGSVNVSAFITDDTSVQSAYYRVDSGAWVALGGSPGPIGTWSASINSATYSDGTHTIYVRAVDGEAAEGTNSVSGVIFDNNGPVITAIAPNAGSGNQSGTINISANITDATSGVSSAQYQIDNNGWQLLSGSEPNYSVSGIDVSSLNNGSHTLYISAQDGTGLWATNNATFTVANNAPPVITAVSPTPGSTVNGAVNIDATITDDAGVTTVTVTVDGGTAQTMTLNSGSATSGTWRYSWNTTVIGNGSHSISIRAVDGGSLNDTTNYTLVVNNGGIVINITSPAAGYVHGNETISAGITYSAGSITAAEYRIGGGSWATLPNTGGSTYSTAWNTTSTADGATTVAVRAQNNVGAWATNSVAVTVDNTPPTIVITSPSAGSVTGNVSVNATNSSDSGSGLVNPLQYRIDSGSWVNLSGGMGIWDSTTISDGSHILYVRGSDSAGNSATNSVSITVQNNTAPIVQTISQPTVGTHTGSANVSAFITDDTSVQSAFYRVDSGSWVALSGTPGASGTWTGTINSTVYSDGTHTIYVRGVDGDSLAGTNSVSGIVFDNTAPVITAIAPNFGSGNQAGTINISANINDATSGINTAQYQIDSNGWQTLSGSEPNYAANNVDISSLNDGTHTLYIRGEDTQGICATNNAIFTVANNAAPVITAVSPTPGSTVSGTASIDATVTDDAGVTGVTVTIDGGSAQTMTLNSGSATSGTWRYSWNTTSIGNGSHTIIIRAVDSGSLNDTTNYTLVVNNGGIVINITSPSAGYVSGSESITADITYSAGSITAAEYRIGSGSWANLPNTGGSSYSTIWSTTSMADGATTVAVRAQNNIGAWATNSVAVTVDNTIPTIVITSPVNSATISNSVNITVTTNDVGGSGIVITSLEYRIDSGAWQTMSGALTVVWNTTNVSDGNHTIQVRGNDGEGNTGISSGIIVTVQNNNATPPAAVWKVFVREDIENANNFNNGQNDYVVGAENGYFAVLQTPMQTNLGFIIDGNPVQAEVKPITESLGLTAVNGVALYYKVPYSGVSIDVPVTLTITNKDNANKDFTGSFTRKENIFKESLDYSAQDHLGLCFELTRTADEIRYEVYSLSGRLLWQYTDVNVAPGNHCHRFDFNNDADNPLPNGVYFIKKIAKSGTDEETEITKAYIMR